MLAGGLFTLGLVVGLAAPTDVKAAVFHENQPGFQAFLNVNSLTDSFVTPGLDDPTFIDAVFSDNASADVNPQSPAHVQTVLESSLWFNTPLTAVGGGACGDLTILNGCLFDNSTNGGTSILTANVFAVHFDNFFLAFLYSGVSNFSIDGLPHGVSNIYAYNTSVVPLPAALPLYGSALAVLGLIGWRRKRMAA